MNFPFMLTTDSETAPFLQNKNEVKKKIIAKYFMVLVNKYHYDHY